MQPQEPSNEEFSSSVRSNRSASTALFLAMVALVSSYALVGGLLAIPAFFLARRALRQLRAGRSVRHRSDVTMAAGAIPVAGLAVLLSVVFGYYWIVYLPQHRHHLQATTQVGTREGR